MSKEDIVAGIKNAIERGYSLEQAKQSFINAGYSNREVEEAASSLTGVINELPQIQQIPQVPETKPQIPEQIKQELRQQMGQEGVIKKPNSKKIIMTIIVIILIIILLAALSVLAGLFFSPEKTKEILSSIFPLLGQ